LKIHSKKKLRNKKESDADENEGEID